MVGWGALRSRVSPAVEEAGGDNVKQADLAVLGIRRAEEQMAVVAGAELV